MMFKWSSSFIQNNKDANVIELDSKRYSLILINSTMMLGGFFLKLTTKPLVQRAISKALQPLLVPMIHVGSKRNVTSNNK